MVVGCVLAVMDVLACSHLCGVVSCRVSACVGPLGTYLGALMRCCGLLFVAV
jgi:hypothetical protein